MVRIFLALCVASASVSSVFAQGLIKPPKRAPLTDLTALAHAKAVSIDDESVIRFAFPKWKVTWKEEVTTEEVLVEKVETKVVNGKKVEIKVQVPEERIRRGFIPILNPNGMGKSDIPIADVKAWDMTGKKLSSAELKTHLKEAKPALPFDEVPEDDSSPLDPYYASVFRADMIVVFNEQLIEDIEASSPFPPLPNSEDAPPVPAEIHPAKAPVPPAP